MLIETARLRLRPRVREDVVSIVTMDSDPNVRRFMGGPLDPQVHREEVLANILIAPSKHWSWAIERKGSCWASRYVFTSPIGRHQFHMHGLAIDASALEARVRN
jgi:RimJ/RimL family protein N-acetyltransferase